MRSILLCGVPSAGTPQIGYVLGSVLRIRERDFSKAISLSVVLKRPDRISGAIVASRASSLTEGSARVYIPVVYI